MKSIIPCNPSSTVSEYQLPAPQWELRENNIPITFMDNNTVYGDDYGARVPLINQALIDGDEIFVEYGRIKPTYFRSIPGAEGLRQRGRKINWYSSWVAQEVMLMGYSGGQHEYNGTILAIDRPNMFPAGVQGYLAPSLPRGAFYRMVDCRFYDGSNVVGIDPRFVAGQPHMTGGKIHKMAHNVISPSTNVGRRVQQNQLKDMTHLGSEWYARLVVKRNGRVIQQGPHSEPLFIDRHGPIYWDEFNRAYNVSASGGWNAKITIGHKYKK